MPIIQENNNSKTQYFKLKTFQFTKNFYNKSFEVKEPAFLIYNGSENVMVGQTFKGNLYDINLGEPKEITTKTGTKLNLMEIYFEFRGLNKENHLIKEVVVLTYPSNLFEKLVQKLAGAKTFKDIKINVGQYTDKNSDKKKDYVTVFEGNKKLPNIINFKSTKPEYPDPEGLIEIPSIDYIDIEDGTKMVNPNWKLKLKKLYWSEFEKIRERLAKYKAENYGPEFNQSEVEECEVDIHEVSTQEDFEPVHEDLPLEPTDQELKEAFEERNLGAKMPF